MSKTYSPVGFIIRVLAIAGSIFALLLVLSVTYDDYGIFRSHTERRIWHKEKNSKFLLAHKYIPENFDALIVGPSFSNNLNPADIPGYNIYNCSMSGANITEVRRAADLVLERGNLKFIIICMNPFMTKNRGVKGQQLGEMEYWKSALFPSSLSKSLAARYTYMPRISIKKKKVDGFHASTNGFNDFNLKKKNVNFKKIVKRSLSRGPKKIIINEKAMEELDEFLKNCRKKKVQIIAFYYPIYHELLQMQIDAGYWQRYKKQADKLLRETDIVLDMNSDNYADINQNPESYSDKHLSNEGARKVCKILKETLDEHYRIQKK
ncbi:MAG: hypothetical protein HRT89_08835 [Lentisphaeria bacterium]|nr:hypothetical protein [Lentisphaeria bacterium]NQZ68163.1 hypothetical protein [Lentisphaeria bacterium]